MVRRDPGALLRGLPVLVLLVSGCSDLRVKEGIYTTPACAAIPKGHPGPQELAELFINRALSAEAQVGMAQGLWYGPTNRKVKLDDPRITENLVMPENFKSVVPVDVPALAKVRQEWITRYDQVLKG